MLRTTTRAVSVVSRSANGSSAWPLALHRGEPELADPLLDLAVDADLGGPALRRRHLLLRGWAALLRDDEDAARTALGLAADLADAAEPHDEPATVALEVALARRAGETRGLLDLWSRARQALLRHPVDLYCLLPWASWPSSPPGSASRAGSSRTSPRPRPCSTPSAGPRRGAPPGTGRVCTRRSPRATRPPPRRTPTRSRPPSPSTTAAAATVKARRAGAVLTERERDIAALVLEGLTYREIATRLFLSAKTVEHHVSRIRRRLGSESRAELFSELRVLVGA